MIREWSTRLDSLLFILYRWSKHCRKMYKMCTWKIETRLFLWLVSPKLKWCLTKNGPFPFIYSSILFPIHPLTSLLFHSSEGSLPPLHQSFITSILFFPFWCSDASRQWKVCRNHKLWCWNFSFIGGGTEGEGEREEGFGVRMMNEMSS